MSLMKKRASLVLIAMFAILLPTVATSTAGASSYQPTEATYQVEFTNITSGQYLTPPNFAAHDYNVDVFQRGEQASPGVQAVAENGAVPVLAEELAAAVASRGGVSGVGGDGPLAPGASSSFEFTTSSSRLSIVSMIICTNDGFAGLDSRRLPTRDGQTRTYRLSGYDAGTEINTENRIDIVPAPFCGDGEGSGESNPELAENGVIKRHRTLRGVGDLPATFDWSGPVAEIQITRVDPAPTYTINVENITTGQYLTPPNFAVHNQSVDVFQRGQKASPGVQAVAENGGVPILAAELAAAIDANGLGVSGVGQGDLGPLAPGAERTFTVTSKERKLSIVSMVVCTNDGFAGLDSRNLPRWDGDSRTFYVRAFDAGTEVNTENRADIVPAPFCGDGEGSGESNPELAENGVITNHRTLRGVGDLPDTFDWRGPVMKVTVTRNA